MDKSKEKGILKLEPKTREKCVLTPQGSYDLVPSSPQPSVDRLSVSWADPGMAASGVNLFHLPSETPINNEIKFSPAGDLSEDEDYSASLSAVLRQRRCSVRRSRKGRRRTSSPFLPDEVRTRRRSSVFTTSSGETAISMDDSGVVTQEEIFKKIRMHKEVLTSVKQQPLGMRRKLKLIYRAKTYIKRHEGQLQERLAQSKNTRDIYARFNILLTARWQQLKREAANTSNILIPWELRIKEIESHFGSVVASYFTFLRWLFWVNLVIGFILLVFVIVPECLIGQVDLAGERKKIRPEDKKNSTNLLTLWEFEGVLKVSPIFYGFYSNIETSQYRMPLAYFLTGLVVYIYSFVAILRKMAENSRMSKLSEKEDECIFSWKLFTGWDFMIGNTETAQNRAASVILGFKEALLEEAEKKKDPRNWRIISIRAAVNLGVAVLLSISVFTVITVVSSDSNKQGYLNENMTTIVVTLISLFFPWLFELFGLLERYHPRTQLRWLLARIMLLNLFNLFSLIFALFRKIQGMSEELEHLKPIFDGNSSLDKNAIINKTIAITVPILCAELEKSCLPYDVLMSIPTALAAVKLATASSSVKPFKENPSDILKSKNKGKIQTKQLKSNNNNNNNLKAGQQSAKALPPENLVENDNFNIPTTEPSLIRSFEIKWNITDTGYVSETDQSGEEVNYYDDTTTIWTETTDTDHYTTNYATTDFNYTTLNMTKYSPGQTDVRTTEDVISIDYSNYSPSTVQWKSTMTENTSGFESTDITTESTTSESNETTNTADDTTISHEYFVTSGTTNDLSTSKLSKEFHTSPTDIYYASISSEEVDSTVSTEETTLDITNMPSTAVMKSCPEAVFNCTMNCGVENITQMIIMKNCQVETKLCFVTRWQPLNMIKNESLPGNLTGNERDIVYLNNQNIKMYNLTSQTRAKLVKLCWETMFGQELVKLTLMDLVFLIFNTLFLDFFRALFVRYMNRFWCWNMEKNFPEYGDFKIAENILHLINNQGTVWMGMFFSPGLVVLNVFKLVIMMYLRSWAVMTCNVPHEVVFRVSKSNNFYLGLLLTMLFLCVLPVGYSIVWVKPSWHCGPFSEHERIYEIMTKNLYSLLPDTLNFAVKYIASPAIVIPLLVLLILIIYYLISLTNSLREANNDLKIQLRRERTEERRKMFQLVDTGRRGQSAMDNTPFARWKKALQTEGLPLGKSIDSDDRKGATEEDGARPKSVKKKGSFLANLVGQIIDKKSDLSELENDVSLSPNNDDETDTDFHETLPKEILKVKDITIAKPNKKNVEFNTKVENAQNQDNHNLKVKLDKEHRTDRAAMEKRYSDAAKTKVVTSREDEVIEKKLNRKQTSESSTHSKQSDLGSVIPVITISTTESDDDFLNVKERAQVASRSSRHKKQPDLKSLRRQSSVDSVHEQKQEKKKPDEGHKYQYSL